jgi:ATP-dependent phosphofructokinase / diphosphate-dependent phosphofructokinase
MADRGKLAILVGGGPAPGINSVIGAATIRGVLGGVEVLGVNDGFEYLMKGSAETVRPLNIEKVSRLHFRGGSVLGTSRANPTKDPKHLDAVRDTLSGLGVTMLITIGGDDTAFSAMKVAERSGGKIRVVHVPKTIDNDLDLPPHIDTFGYQTARHVGVEVVKNLMVDAHTTSRWYLVISMGRKAGHLALGIGKSVGATLTLIGEEFAGAPIKLNLLADTLAGAIIKRLSTGRKDGVAVIAEGVVLDIDPQDLAQLQNVERDEHGHVRIAEIAVGDILKKAVLARLKQLGVKTTIVSKDIGYELRCADPVPQDMEYTRDLGYCAARSLLEGGGEFMVSMQGGKFVPVPFRDLLDPKTGRTRVRLVDINSDRYAIARRYMIRLRRDDFTNPAELEKIARVVKLSPEEFRKQFAYVTEQEPAQMAIKLPGPAT